MLMAKKKKSNKNVGTSSHSTSYGSGSYYDSGYGSADYNYSESDNYGSGSYYDSGYGH